MADQVLNRYVPSEVSPPGETLRELLEERGLTQADLVARMGRPKKTISEIINGKASITPETALELELVLGTPASFWNARERDYRAWLARREQEKRLAGDQAWARRFPIGAMTRLGLLPEVSGRPAQVRALLEFFGVASSEQWGELSASYQVAFRRSTKFESDPHALSAWLRAGASQAERLATQPYNRDGFLEALRKARGLTREPPKVFESRLPRLCAEAGVVVLFVPELPGSRASGATRWLGPERALIQLSLRYKTDDHLWFTFFHEAAHILLHGKKLIFLEGDKHEGQAEEEANRWAADFLIPAEAYGELEGQHARSVAGIRAFADGLGIAPGIVVGRLQHEKRLPYAHCNELKQRFEWD